MNEVEWTVSGISDRGLQRADNQDNYFISSDKRVLVVADGMGGAANGALASRLAIEAVQKKWREAPPNYAEQEMAEAWILEAVREANSAVMKLQIHKNASHNPGTTIVAAVQTDDGVLSIAHVGDSRAVRCFGGAAENLTRDHSFVMEMMTNNQLTEEQAWSSPYKNILTRCLGHDEDVKIDQSSFNLRKGDWVLLCSDGLCGVLRSVHIAKIVNECETTNEVCERLLAEVLDNDAPDNVTIIALRVGAKTADKKTERTPAANGTH